MVICPLSPFARKIAKLLAMQVNMHDAKSRLSELVAAAESGEDVVIARNGAPAVRLVVVHVEHRPVRLGLLGGEIEIGEDFDAPLPDFKAYE
jgi:prevent-host-death family protein